MTNKHKVVPYLWEITYEPLFEYHFLISGYIIMVAIFEF